MLIKNAFPELTNKQYKVLELYSLGCIQKQVAQQLNISCNTLKEHLYAIKHKLGCTSISELRAIFLNRLLSVILKRDLKA